MSGLLANVQIRVELEQEQIREQSWLMKQTVELAQDNQLKLRNVTYIHVQVTLLKLFSFGFRRNFDTFTKQFSDTFYVAVFI